MTKTGIAASVAVLMALTGPAALAQTKPMPEARHMTATPAALTVQPDQMRASKLIGTSVYDVQNQDIGSVKDLILTKGGEVSAVVLDVGSFLGMGGKYVAVSLNDLKTSNDRLTLAQTKDQLKAAPSFQLEPKDQNGHTNPTNQAGH
ncbi:MAG TPA: PRC-barrel domain-containing protein [Stellaceae bacterium]|jgi:sporulation protein YlmC with PRC-barrel domain